MKLSLSLIIIVLCLISFVGCNNSVGPSSSVLPNNGLQYYTVSSLYVSGSKLFAGTLGAVLFLSTDDGSTWTTLGTLTSQYMTTDSSDQSGVPAPPRITSIVAIGTDLFVGIGGNIGGIFYSTNNGTNWTKRDSGLLVPQSQRVPNITSFAIVNKTIFAGTFDGIFLSVNEGNSWSIINTGMFNQVYQLAVIGTKIYAATDQGVFLSSNAGMTWISFNNGLLNNYVSCLVAVGTTLVAWTSQGVYRAVDGRDIWTTINPGLTNRAVNVLNVSGTSLYAGADGGVFLSSDEGTTWRNISSGSKVDSLANISLAVLGSKVFVGTEGNGVWCIPM